MTGILNLFDVNLCHTRSQIKCSIKLSNKIKFWHNLNRVKPFLALPFLFYGFVPGRIFPLETGVRQTRDGEQVGGIRYFLVATKPDQNTIYNHPCHSFSLLDTNPLQLDKLLLKIQTISYLKNTRHKRFWFLVALKPKLLMFDISNSISGSQCWHMMNILYFLSSVSVHPWPSMLTDKSIFTSCSIFCHDKKIIIINVFYMNL